MSKELVLYSGSIQSLLALAATIAIRDKGDETYMMVFDYGQKNMTKFEYASRVAEYYEISKQDTTDANGVVDEHFFINNVIDLNFTDNKMLTLVQIGTLAIGYCLKKGISKIIYGTDEIEYNELELVNVENAIDTINDAFGNKETYIAEFMNNDDTLEGLLEGSKELPVRVPFELAMTCEQGEYPLCGKCDNCIDRKSYFKAADVEDSASFAV